MGEEHSGARTAVRRALLHISGHVVQHRREPDNRDRLVVLRSTFRLQSGSNELWKSKNALRSVEEKKKHSQQKIKFFRAGFLRGRALLFHEQRGDRGNNAIAEAEKARPDISHGILQAAHQVFRMRKLPQTGRSQKSLRRVEGQHAG